MKIFKLLGLTLMATIISIPLSSCGSDDDNDSPGMPVDPQAKRITRIIQKEDKGDKTEYKFSYDSQGRVIVMDIQATSYNNSFLFYYDDNTITITSDDNSTYKCSLNEGRIISEYSSYRYNNNTSLINFSYDKNGQMIKTDTSIISWNDGDLMETVTASLEEGWTTKYDYSKFKTPANYFPFGLFEYYWGALAMTGYFGKMPSHLINSISYHHNDNYYTTIYSYQMQDGLPVKINYKDYPVDREKSPGGEITIEWD